MPWGLRRFQQSRCQHFITFSCYRRQSFFDTAPARERFEIELERVRMWYGIYIAGYVVMPEHVHLLVSEPERSQLSVAVQMLKQMVARRLRRPGVRQFWQARYYDFPVWSAKKEKEKLGYIHRNPVSRGLVAKPEDWEWSSFRQWATGCDGRVEVESQWTASKRESTGAALGVARAVETPALRQNRAKGRGNP